MGKYIHIFHKKAIIFGKYRFTIRHWQMTGERKGDKKSENQTDGKEEERETNLSGAPPPFEKKQSHE